MTEKQIKFCEEYLIDLNATQAAIRAGYSPKTAYSIGDENLKKPEIKKYIEERQAELQKETDITRDDIIKALARFGFAEIDEKEVRPREAITALKYLTELLGFDELEANQKQAEAHNALIDAIREHIENPRPNRNIKDFEPDE